MASSQKRLEGPFHNILKSSEYVTNSRGQILHVRSWVNMQDSSSKPSALVFFLHGCEILTIMHLTYFEH